MLIDQGTMKLGPSRLSIVPAAPEHAADIAARPGPDGAVTVARYGKTRAEIALETIQHSASAWAAIIDGEVLCLFGVDRGTVVGGLHTRPWIILSDDVKRYRKTFWLASKEALAIVLDRHPYLVGSCTLLQRREEDWLRRLGFAVTSACGTESSEVLFEIGAKHRYQAHLHFDRGMKLPHGD